MTTAIPRSLPSAVRVFLRHPSPRMLTAQLVLALAIRTRLGAPSFADALVLVGVAVYWPLQEWLLHRYVLHARPLRLFGRTFESGAARVHRAHHEAPVDLRLALLDPWTVGLLVPIHVAAWVLLAPSARVACTGIVAFGGAALVYEWIHFLTHTAYRPRTRWFAEVKRRHMAHHQRDPQRWFGFTVPRLDDWLGTGGSPR